jgi:hypothetical protein
MSWDTKQHTEWCPNCGNRIHPGVRTQEVAEGIRHKNCLEGGGWPTASTPRSLGAVRRAPAAPFPTRDQLVQVWGDHVIVDLRPKAKALFQAGRFVEVEDGRAVFGLPNEIHRRRCEEIREEIESALSDHFGRPVPLRLVVDPVLAAKYAAPPRERPFVRSGPEPSWFFGWSNALGPLRTEAGISLSIGRFLAVCHGRFVFGLPNALHRARCEEFLAEFEQVLSSYFGHPIEVALVVDAGPDCPRCGHPGECHEEAQWDDHPACTVEIGTEERDDFEDARLFCECPMHYSAVDEWEDETGFTWTGPDTETAWFSGLSPPWPGTHDWDGVPLAPHWEFTTAAGWYLVRGYGAGVTHVHREEWPALPKHLADAMPTPWPLGRTALAPFNGDLVAKPDEGGEP